MRFLAWLAGLIAVGVGAYLYRPISEFNLEIWLSVGIAVAVCSILAWTSTVIDRVVDPKEGDSRGVFTFLISVAFALIGIVFVVAIHGDWADKNWGTFGDFLGGVLNPALTFLSFMALLFTIILQQREIHGAKNDAKELRDQRRDDRLSSERMQFENTFFQMLSIHNTIVNSMDVDRGQSKNQLRGRDCFKHFRDIMKDYYDADPTPDELRKALAAHDKLWESCQNDLAHYYRYFYNIIRFINESDVDKTRYIRILRAQFSDFELLVMFYNGLIPLAAKSKEYVEFFSMLNNLPKDLLFNPSHESFYEPSAFDEKAQKKPLSFTDYPPPGA
ncbi:putative phage abortive infection protein [Rhizobium sp. GN54]|uniref:putative phage abortive infection protein n=1 Tax=Rhizobium sp. GN54 TaxID=2898150 RepID=UPI001E4CF6E4|nr:putative phage abortive infection protein [Rhizobium sp. GN54]MCD2184882.1 putative phage abortive infection protein [Rhizobium sp. GN54]